MPVIRDEQNKVETFQHSYHYSYAGGVNQHLQQVKSLHRMT
jgi:hypothetical protein